MVSINYSAREVCCKIVYYGPGLSGKTTNLQYIHSKVPQKTRGKLISLATEADRTLYFDFLPINIGTIDGFQAKFQLYTVPGQVYYNATRKLVLRGVDGVVFVADSQADKMDENIESLANLEENLREYGYDPDDLPLVIQYNKRDLPGVLSVEELEVRLNQKGRLYYEASATIGNGVFDTLKQVIKLVLDRAKSNSASNIKPADVQAPQAAMSQPVRESVPAQPDPVSDPVYSRTAPGPVETTSPASPEQATSSEPPPSPVGERTSVYRPYPGSDSPDQMEQSAPSNDAIVSRQDELSADSLGRNIGAEPVGAKEGATGAGGSPQMAPSLRRRGERKRRGFFKRLFGLK